MAKTKSVSKGPLVIGIVSLVLVAAVAVNFANSRDKGAVEPSRDSIQTKQDQPKDVKVYTPSYDKGDLKLKPTRVEPPKSADPMVFAVNQFLGSVRAVPSQARCVKADVKGDVLTLDFTSQFETTYGTEDEQTVLKGILRTVSQFKGVAKVRFTVHGNTLETLGNIDLTEPQPVSAGGADTPADTGQ